MAVAFWQNFSWGQNPQETKSGLRIMFYNVENLFHPSDDSLKNDEEFTPEGTRFWSYKRYKDKLNKIGKTVLAVGEWEPPAVIGLCEIENIQCLNDLVYNSPLKKFGYKIIHQESGDRRGIDVAMLYREDYFKPVSFHPFVLKFGEDSRPTRDILYVKGTTHHKDTLHLFVNHWPSRYGGQLATAPKREEAARVLRSKYDSIMTVNPNASIIAMGDFNDHPDDISMHEVLKAQKDTTTLSKEDLINTVWQYEFKKGTHKYDHEWGILDQFVITQALLKGKNGLKSGLENSHIFDADFLLEEEKDGVGKITNRTYIGFKYHGGYSDHLPIFIDVLFVRQ
ncbi:endonuclease [Paracrocinitomix mangrovi]|uniref:endonuclease/exonuclease/phosphatase family protein n=1 Tax=Paracrocinitomix mangrovi TaxID=2862509 RepID=UPI001C8DE4A0|nr:endonuclease/exonuclease/phosphatase family protein [Paracrocinitomix mangrovi]UKN03248.1 endonuclease [Paracrocinitomix mangrovi]